MPDKGSRKKARFFCTHKRINRLTQKKVMISLSLPGNRGNILIFCPDRQLKYPKMWIEKITKDFYAKPYTAYVQLNLMLRFIVPLANKHKPSIEEKRSLMNCMALISIYTLYAYNKCIYIFILCQTYTNIYSDMMMFQTIYFHAFHSFNSI